MNKLFKGDKLSCPMSQAFKFPSEIKSMITELKNEKQWLILESIIDENNDISYTKLREKLGYSLEEKGDLNYHLNNLERYGWLENKVKVGHMLSDRRSSYYNVSKFGLKILEGAVQAMNRKNYVIDSMGFFGKKKLGENKFLQFHDNAKQEYDKLKIEFFTGENNNSNSKLFEQNFQKTTSKRIMLKGLV